MRPADPVDEQTDAVTGVLRRVLGDRLLAAYRYGSSVVGGLRPESDLDVMGLGAGRTTDREKRELIRGLTPISRRGERPAGWRPVEVTLLVADEVRPWRWPPRFDFQYGEWLRSEFAAGNLSPWPPENPDVAVLATMVRQHGVPLIGPPADQLLDPVPRADIVRATIQDLEPLLADLASDTRNVLLTLARMWCTLATGDLRTKDEAAEWARARLVGPAPDILALAAEGYRTGGAEDWQGRMPEARSAARDLAGKVRRAAAETGPEADRP